MGKTARLKGDLDDVEALLEIITVLKDVSTNRFFQFAQRKENLAKFLQVFLDFFDLLNASDSNCPLIRNDHPGIDILCISSEASFMSQLNGRVARAAFNEFQKNKKNAHLVCVGWRGADRCRAMGMKVERLYRDIDQQGIYNIALQVRDYLVNRVMNGSTGRVVCVYTWAKSFNIIKPRVVSLLPASEFITNDEPGEEGQENQDQSVLRQRMAFIQESSIDGIMQVLADVWVSSRLYELLSDQKLAEAASQAQQLEQSIESLSKEKKGLMLSIKKSQRGDLNKAMREVFTSSKLCGRKR